MDDVVTGVALLVLLLLLVVAALDFWFIADPNAHPLGELLQAWARHYTPYAMAVAAITGALLGHFFWQ